MGIHTNSHDFDFKELRHAKKARQFLIPEQGVRLAVVVPIFMMIGFYATEEMDPSVHSYVFTWALWVAMTMVLVSSNEMGGVMTDGIRRFSGAVITGILATTVVWIFTNEQILPHNKWIKSDAIIVALAGVFVMFFAQVFVQLTGYKRTTVMVCQLFIKCCFVGKANDFTMVWSIILGVCTGVLMISIVSVVIFPRSSSYQAMIKLKLALDKLEKLSKLTMHELITASIDPQDQIEENKFSESGISLDMFGCDVQQEGELVAQLTQVMKIEDSVLRKCEEMMYSIYDTLNSMKTHLKASRNEIFITSRQTKDGPKWILIPGAKIFRCICMNPLPYDELEYVQYNIQRVARHLWAVLLSIDHMWDETVQEVIKQRYPQEVLPKIHDLTTDVLKDIANAFPSQYYVSRKNLAGLEMHVEVMLNISNRWRTRATIKTDQNDTLAEQGRQRALKRALTRTKQNENKRTPTSLAISQATSGVLMPAYRSRTVATAAKYGRCSSVLAARAASAAEARPRFRTPNIQMVVEEDKINFSLSELDKKKSSRAVRFSNDLEARNSQDDEVENQTKNLSLPLLQSERMKTEDLKNQFLQNSLQEQKRDLNMQEEINEDMEVKHSPFIGMLGTKSEVVPNQAGTMGSIARQVFEDSRLQKEVDPELGSPLIPKPVEEKKSLGNTILKQLQRIATIKSRKKLKVEVKHGQRQQRRETAHIHSSEDLFVPKTSSSTSHQPLSDQDHTIQDDSSFKPPSVDARFESAAIDSIEFDLPLVEEQLALSFPESEEGHTQEARWYSFQFQIDELLDAIIELHTAVNDLLEHHLPKLSLNQKLIERYQIRQYY